MPFAIQSFLSIVPIYGDRMGVTKISVLSMFVYLPIAGIDVCQPLCVLLVKPTEKKRRKNGHVETAKTGTLGRRGSKMDDLYIARR
jgi:hypothetical protein